MPAPALLLLIATLLPLASFTLLVFVGFSWLYLREPLGWNHILGFALIALGAAVVFLGKPTA